MLIVSSYLTFWNPGHLEMIKIWSAVKAFVWTQTGARQMICVVLGVFYTCVPWILLIFFINYEIKFTIVRDYNLLLYYNLPLYYYYYLFIYLFLSVCLLICFILFYLGLLRFYSCCFFFILFYYTWYLFLRLILYLEPELLFYIYLNKPERVKINW